MASPPAGGTVGLVVHDLGDGASAELNADHVFPAASLFKLPVMVETLRQARLGQLDLDEPLEIRPQDWTDGSGVLQARVGDHLPARELLRLMIEESDNIAALVLLDRVGVASTNATLASLGLPSTRLHDHLRGDPGEHVTSPRDMARLLELTATGQLIDHAVSQQALALLSAHQANSWLTQDLPFWAGASLAHKWGDLPDARHDAGIVFTRRGNYLAVVLTEGARPDEALRTITAVSRAAFDGLGG